MDKEQNDTWVGGISHCAEHPRYKGKNQPRAHCAACWLVCRDANPCSVLMEIPKEVSWRFIKDHDDITRNYCDGKYVPKRIARKRAKEEQDAWEIAHNKIMSRLTKYEHVIYSAYEADEAGNPVDNLDKVCVHGKVQFKMIWTDPVTQFEELSPVINSPTWFQACEFADKQVERHKEMINNVFLEDVTVQSKRNGDVKIVTFDMGS